MFGKILLIILVIMVSAVIVGATICIISDIRDIRRKYVYLFSTESTVIDNDTTWYYESIYGITDTGNVRLLRTTMKYTTKEGANKEKELIMKVLAKKN